MGCRMGRTFRCGALFLYRAGEGVRKEHKVILPLTHTASHKINERSHVDAE